MCTLTLLRASDRCLITMNRDDLIARPESPPKLDGAHGAHMIAPLDLKAGGTWIGLNRHGLVACLLNRYDQAAPSDGLSRGVIVPEALLGRDVGAAFDRVTGRDRVTNHPEAHRLDGTGPIQC
jgi:uncharacterized protein with NRDE domain